MQLDAQATLEMNAAAIAPLGDIHFETQTPSSVWAIDFAGWPEEILEDLMQLVGGTEEDE